MSANTVRYLTTIKVHDQFIAQHRWAECPIDEVRFLRNWHRHVFHVHVELHVSHGNRDEEFFMVQSKLRSILKCWEGGQHDMSCEMFAERVMTQFLQWGFLVRTVTVSEDDENSATLLVLNVNQPPSQTIEFPTEQQSLS